MELQAAVSKQVLGKVCMKQLKEMTIERIQGQVTEDLTLCQGI